MAKPIFVLKVFDQPGYFDRYTVVLSDDFMSAGGDEYACLSLSHNPDDPQGFSQFSTCSLEADIGREIQWSDLSDRVRTHVIERCNDEASL